MRSWKTEIHMTGGEDYPESVTTSYKTYKMLDVKKAIDDVRLPEELAGLPKRKLKPVSKYVLEHLVQQFFKERKGAVLTKIIVEDTKTNGL